MHTLRPLARLYIAILTLGAFVGTGGALRGAAAPRGTGLALAAALCACVAAAYLFPIHLAFRTKLNLDAAAITAAFLLFPPGQAALIVGVGTFLAHRLRRQPWPQTAFNCAQTMLQALLGGGLLGLLGWHPAAPQFDDPGFLLALLLTGACLWWFNTLAVATIVGLQSGQSPLRVWYQTRRSADWSVHLAPPAQLGLGLLAALLADSHLWALPLLLAPACAVQVALRMQLDQRRWTEEALGRAEANLAEAQQLAQLGSWEWDLQTGEQFWSAEVFRIAGADPDARPSYDALLAAVHPADRRQVAAVLQGALASRQPYDLDHRLLRPDGTERIVHHLGKVVVAPDGGLLRLVGTLHDITARKALEAQLAHQAFHDPLTGLANRARFLDRLAQALAPEKAGEGQVAVIFADLDRFKEVNDTLGHEAGDTLLVAAAGRIAAAVRPGDLAARLGGDEFTVLLTGLRDRREAVAVAERLAEALRAPYAHVGQAVRATGSVGLAVGRPGRDTPRALLHDADQALYRAKRDGRARLALAGEEPQDDDGDAPAVALAAAGSPRRLP